MSESKDAVLRFYEAAASGDPDALAATVHEDFRAEAPPMLPWGGVTEGRDAVNRQFDRLIEALRSLDQSVRPSAYVDRDLIR